MKTLLYPYCYPRAILVSILLSATFVLKAETGSPSSEERAEMVQRRERLMAAHAKSTLAVIPVAARNGAQHEIAARVAQALSATSQFSTVTAPTDLPVLKTGHAGVNEAKILWEFAQGVRDYVRTHPAGADYFLAVDYSFNPKNWKQAYVHFVICDREGGWVFVEMQNSHYAIYQQVKPVTAEDCEKILLRKIEKLLNPAPAKGSS